MDISKLKQRNFNPDSVPGEYNFLDTWMTFNGRRWLAGVMAGIFAGLAMVIFGSIICASKGVDVTFPAKVGALPWLGAECLEFGSVKAIVIGLLSHLSLSALLGATYAHFTGVNNPKALFGMGITWGIFSWIFIHNLMARSIPAYRTADLPTGIMFFAWLVFGVSLMSVAVFDRLLATDASSLR